MVQQVILHSGCVASVCLLGLTCRHQAEQFRSVQLRLMLMMWDCSRQIACWHMLPQQRASPGCQSFAAVRLAAVLGGAPCIMGYLACG